MLNHPSTCHRVKPVLATKLIEREPIWCAVAGFKYVVYLPETQAYIEQTPRVLMRRSMKYLPEQDTFEDLAEAETFTLLEPWGFARTTAAASKPAAPSTASLPCITLLLLLWRQETWCL